VYSGRWCHRSLSPTKMVNRTAGPSIFTPTSS
jgi:hypothetical protein